MSAVARMQCWIFAIPLMIAYRTDEALSVSTSDLSACFRRCPLGGKELSASNTPLLPVELPGGFRAPAALLGFGARWGYRSRKVQQIAKRLEALARRTRLVQSDLFIDASLKIHWPPAAS